MATKNGVVKKPFYLHIKMFVYGINAIKIDEDDSLIGVVLLLVMMILC